MQTVLAVKRDSKRLSTSDKMSIYSRYKDTFNLEDLENLTSYCEQHGVHIDITLAKKGILYVYIG